MSDLNYDEDLKIDPDALDVECLRQPQLFMEYAEAASEARRDMDFAKEELEVGRASLNNDIRRNPSEYLGEGIKVTEAVIVGAIIVNKKYQDLLKKHLEAKHNYDLLSSAVKAFEQRKSSLEYLIRLTGQQYFSGPESPRDLKGEYGRFVGESKKEVTRGKIKEKMRRKR